MIETLLGGALGGVLRFAPEVLKFLAARDDRKHEAVMLDKQLAADRQRAELNIRAIEAQDAATINSKDADALIAALESQGRPTGVPWVDAFNAFIRPFLTFYWCVILYSLVMLGRWVLLTSGAVGPLEALVALWGPDEKAIVGSMFAFWFVDRTLRKGGGLGPAH